jgi:hypothetical protein
MSQNIVSSSLEDDMMKGIKLTKIEEFKYKVIKNLVDNDGNKKNAALKLNMSERNINRLIKKYKFYGKEAFRHKNHDNKPATTINESVKERIVKLYEEKYYEFNFTHFNEMLKEREYINVSYNVIYTTLKNADILSPKARKFTKKEHSKKMKELENQVKEPDENVQIKSEINNKEIPLEDSHPRQERSKYFGEIVQMDASLHLWFGTFKAQLHLAIDDATSQVLAGRFELQETLKGYYHITYDIITKYGIPYCFFTDRRTIFEYEKLNKKDIDKDTFTQYSFACSLLGTEIRTSSVPQAKGRIERSFGTFQDRLISELRLEGITTLEEANIYLQSFIQKHNNKFASPINNSTSVFEKQPEIEELNLILATRYERTVDNGNCVKFKNKYYRTFRDGQMKCIRPKTKSIVIEAFDQQLYLEAGDYVYQLIEVKLNKETSNNIDTPRKSSEEINRSKAHKPNKDHLWSNSTIKKYQKKLRDSVPSLEEFFNDCTIEINTHVDLYNSIETNKGYY